MTTQAVITRQNPKRIAMLHELCTPLRAVGITVSSPKAVMNAALELNTKEVYVATVTYLDDSVRRSDSYYERRHLREMKRYIETRIAVLEGGRHAP